MNFVFDLDGTICFKGLPVSDKILNVLEKVQLRGHNVIFASARPIRDMLPVLDEKFHTYTMIGGNGSLVSKNGVLLHINSFTNLQVELIKQVIEEFKATYLIDGEWDYSYTGPINHPILKNIDPARMAKKVDLNNHESIIKILILTSENMEELAERVTVFDVVTNKHGNENILDISPKGIHKWNALSQLNVKVGEYIAFGNDANDISMFMNAKYSVMIGEHKELSEYATDSIQLDENTENRIVEKLEGFLQDYEVVEKCN